MPIRPVLTLHAPLAPETAEIALAGVQRLMDKYGFTHWLNPDAFPDYTLMIDCPQAWIDRSPTPAEWEHFNVLYEAGRIEEAQNFARRGGWSNYR